MRTTSYSLPAHLHEHVELVQPTTVFGSLKAFRSTIVLPDDEMTFTRDAEGNTLLATAATNCTATITVDCIKQYYAHAYAEAGTYLLFTISPHITHILASQSAEPHLAFAVGTTLILMVTISLRIACTKLNTTHYTPMP